MMAGIMESDLWIWVGVGLLFLHVFMTADLSKKLDEERYQHKMAKDDLMLAELRNENLQKELTRLTYVADNMKGRLKSAGLD